MPEFMDSCRRMGLKTSQYLKCKDTYGKVLTAAMRFYQLPQKRTQEGIDMPSRERRTKVILEMHRVSDLEAQHERNIKSVCFRLKQGSIDKATGQRAINKMAKEWTTRARTIQQTLQPLTSGLKIVTITSQHPAHGDDCPVCLNTLEANQQLTMLHPCSHLFHQKCMSRWLKQQLTCPLCRSSLKAEINRL